MVFGQGEIEEAVLRHFSQRFKGSRAPIYGLERPPKVDLDDPQIKCMIDPAVQVDEEKYESEVCSPMTMTELNYLLAKLPNEKSSGVDLIPNEFLKNCGSKFNIHTIMFHQEREVWKEN